jgi:hypothetical protein
VGITVTEIVSGPNMSYLIDGHIYFHVPIPLALHITPLLLIFIPSVPEKQPS